MGILHNIMETGLRRHYTRKERAYALAEARQAIASTSLTLVIDNDISDMTAIACVVGKRTVRLTPFLSGRELVAALHALTLVDTIWRHDFLDEDAVRRQAEELSRADHKAGRRRQTT